MVSKLSLKNVFLNLKYGQARIPKLASKTIKFRPPAQFTRRGSEVQVLYRPPLFEAKISPYDTNYIGAFN